MPKNTNFLFIRHAEKPEEGDNDINLSEAGQARAWAYVAYFQNFKIDSNPIRLDHLFATAQSAKSNRPYLTIEPLSRQLGLTINNFYENKTDDIEALAKYLLLDPGFNDANILICWHHGLLLNLAEKLGVEKRDLPDDWPEGNFGLLMRVYFDKTGNLAETNLVQQHLMYTDRDY